MTAQIGYATALKLLGNKRDSEREYYSALRIMAESEAMLKKFTARVSGDSAESLVEDLLYVQQHGAEELRSFYLVDREILQDGRMAKNFLSVNKPNRDFRGLRFYYTNDLQNANLEGANFEGADLRNMEVSGKNWRGANLKNANLSNAKLGGSFNSRTNFTGAIFDNTSLSGDLRGVNLSGIKRRGFIIGLPRINDLLQRLD